AARRRPEPPGRSAGDRHRQPLRPERDRDRWDHQLPRPGAGRRPRGPPDPPTTPGNPGGGPPDPHGRVIGINSAIRPASDGSNGNVGIGFAVPIDLAAKSAAAIVQGKPLQIGYLGVSTNDATGGQGGAIIQEVTANSPASKAGLKAGDLVTSIDGQAIQSYSEMVARIRAHQPGDKVTLNVTRGGNETTITATLSQRPAR